MNYWTPCEEIRHCCYQQIRYNKKFCLILKDKEGGAPYKSGKCAFYKEKETDFSGRRETCKK